MAPQFDCQQHQNARKCRVELFNAQPMNVESEQNCEHSESCENQVNNNDLVFNEILPQLMMLPGVMMDPSSLLSLQQFPILNLQQAVNQQQQQVEGKNENVNQVVKSFKLRVARSSHRIQMHHHPQRGRDDFVPA